MIANRNDVVLLAHRAGESPVELWSADAPRRGRKGYFRTKRSVAVKPGSVKACEIPAAAGPDGQRSVRHLRRFPARIPLRPGDECRLQAPDRRFQIVSPVIAQAWKRRRVGGRFRRSALCESSGTAGRRPDPSPRPAPTGHHRSASPPTSAQACRTARQATARDRVRPPRSWEATATAHGAGR